jgi:hypothetical protein
MPLLVSLSRPAAKRDVGTFKQVALGADELYERDGEDRLLARHRLNRWFAAEDNDPYVSLDIVGPLTASGGQDPASPLGPYQHMSTYDGVLYMDDRAFGFWDRVNQDWYIVDAGVHLKEVRLSFHPTD